MARAKNTDRAEARRRHREQQRSLDAAETGQEADDTAVTAAGTPISTGGGSLFGGFRMPRVGEDVRALPHMLVHTPKLWIPFGILLLSFAMAMLLPKAKEVTFGLGETATIMGSSVFPEGMDRFAALFVQLTLPPTSLFVFFIGGFLAPRASYLVGALLGVVDGIFWSIYVLSAGGTQEGFKAASIQDVVAIIAIAVLIGMVAAGFAAWYRTFLRQSQERARQNRLAREQQARAKAKEQERITKEEQRKAAAAAREAQRAERSATQAAAKAAPAPNTLSQSATSNSGSKK